MGTVILGATGVTPAIQGGGPGSTQAWAPTIQIDHARASAERAANFEANLLIQRELSAMRTQELADQARESQQQLGTTTGGGGAGSSGCSCGTNQAAAGADAAQPTAEQLMANSTLNQSNAVVSSGGPAREERAEEPPADDEDDRADDAAGVAGAPPAPREGASTEEIKRFIHWAAREFGVHGTLLEKIALYESDFTVDAVNDWDSNARKGTPSKGIMQFIEPTFDWMYDGARKARPELLDAYGSKKWLDWRQQVLTAAWAIGEGKGSHWSTYSRAKDAAEGRPAPE